ncbi:hypothetical protein X747_06440 [Mesorhizobium sp. LNJC384A00]|nr:hypothetical protein X766_15120 [Mesorhizobium sp. LSJC255A00]ESX34545.1 hypothetical protein X764_28350 [Mesorhizobium sp. LSHC440A00]ESX68452.1 hypothetical protein X757_28705 [Mesorhizobium sp. LSHC414A00]ESY44056.1 hypothetical protein X747_06440 [Mesorhizobium sp. LNJC384A00]
MTSITQPYLMAQSAMAQLKAAIHMLLSQAPQQGLRNSEIGRQLGIYMGHVEHQGHIPRTLLSIMESEGAVEQDKATKCWRLAIKKWRSDRSRRLKTAPSSLLQAAFKRTVMLPTPMISAISECRIFTSTSPHRP